MFSIVLLICNIAPFPSVINVSSATTTIYETTLEKNPYKIVHNNSNDCFIVFEDDSAQRVYVKNNKICFSDNWANISLISSENNLVAIVNTEGKFRFEGKIISRSKKQFEKAINKKALEATIIKIVSSDNFTAVLFDDGSVYSDINYIIENNYTENNDFRIYSDYIVKNIFASTCQIVALCENEEIVQCLYVKDQDCIYKKMMVGEGEKITNVCFYDGCLVTTDLKQTYLFEDMFTMDDEIYGTIKDEFSGYNAVESSSYDWGLFLLDDNTLYYDGYTFVGGPSGKYDGYEKTKQVIYSGNNLKHFFCIKGGIITILNNGTIRLIVC